MGNLTMRQRKFKQVDVFTAKPYLGNPLAVVLDGTGLSDADMQHFAQWTNLSETTFVLPPTESGSQNGAHYQVRIFTPGSELPFAGHPTLGSCHAWLQSADSAHAADSPEIVQECKVGLVRIRRDGARLAFAAPTLRRSNPSPALLAQVAGALGIQAQHIVAAQMLDNGPTWLGLLLDSTQTVLQLRPNYLALKGLVPGVGVAARDTAPAPVATSPLIARSNREARAFGARTVDPTDDDAHVALEVRFFAPDIGVGEDPVTGSFNASLAQWLMADGHVPDAYLARQGGCLGRDGQVYLSRDSHGQVWVGGDCVTCIDGNVTL